MTALQTLGIDRLSRNERLELVQDIWDSIAEEDGIVPLSESQRLELDRRLAAHRANPGAAVDWEQVEAEALARLQS